jgi:uncharacterized membrane protein YfcA
MLSAPDFLIAGSAAIAAGAVNALAGGGTLITFPVLIAIGVPAISANITNTVALCPGYLGATLAQIKDVRGQKTRLWQLLISGVLGGVIGSILLLHTRERSFRALVPFLILLASGLLAVQDPVRSWIARRSSRPAGKKISETWTALPVGLAAIYGGYFGAGLSVIILAVLGLTIEEKLARLNALKQAIAFSANIAAAVLFLFSGRVFWSLAIIMAAGAVAGGVLGGRLAGRLNPSTLRWIVVSIGIIVAMIYFVQ